MPRYPLILLIAAVAAGLVVAGRQASIAPTAFSHESHAGINCIDCHHDWPETRARERCMGCHLDRPELHDRLEYQFHALCRGCHAALPPEQAAPAARCSGCHDSGERSERQPVSSVRPNNALSAVHGGRADYEARVSLKSAHSGR